MVVAIVDSALAGIALVTAGVLAGIGAYGLTYSRNFIRQLLSIEILFNALILFILVIPALVPVMLTSFAIILISIVAGEVIVLVAVIAAFYRVARTLDSTEIEEEGV